jgi:hypothetical protein
MGTVLTNATLKEEKKKRRRKNRNRRKKKEEREVAKCIVAFCCPLASAPCPVQQLRGLVPQAVDGNQQHAPAVAPRRRAVVPAARSVKAKASLINRFFHFL